MPVKNHPTWLIEEKVIRARVLVWARPINEPTTKELKTIRWKKLELIWEKLQIINKGLSFWTVKRTNKGAHAKDSATVTSQLWKGAAPSLIASPNKITVILNSVWRTNRIRPPTITITEARVWVRKYLMEDSEVSLFFFERRIGKNARVLSSKPTHEINRDGEDITKKILEVILRIISNKEGVSHIREEV